MSTWDLLTCTYHTYRITCGHSTYNHSKIPVEQIDTWSQDIYTALNPKKNHHRHRHHKLPQNRTSFKCCRTSSTSRVPSKPLYLCSWQRQGWGKWGMNWQSNTWCSFWFPLKKTGYIMNVDSQKNGDNRFLSSWLWPGCQTHSVAHLLWNNQSKHSKQQRGLNMPQH